MSLLLSTLILGLTIERNDFTEPIRELQDSCEFSRMSFRDNLRGTLQVSTLNSS